MIDTFIIDKLDSYKKSIKKTKYSIRFSYMYVVLCISNIVLESSNIIKDIKNWHVYLWLILIAVWVLAIYLTIKNIKNQKLEISKNIQLYYEYFKTVDYPEYIKEQRIKKLKKIKKS